MNVISNTCIGAYLMRDCYHEEYKNPFVWNIINYNSFQYIIENYDFLSDANIRCEQNINSNFPTIFINDYPVLYVHYKDIKYKDIINKNSKNENNVFLDDCEKYALDKFKERLARMDKTPIFVIQVQTNHNITGDIDSLKKFLKNIKTKYKIFIITNLDITSYNANIKIVNEYDIALLNTPKKLALKYCDFLKQNS